MQKQKNFTNSKEFSVSVVIPIFNEEQNIDILYNRLTKVLEKYNQYEIIFTNDGSSDSSEKLLNKLCTKNPNIKLINLSRNFGHQQAIKAGLNYSNGDVTLIMDGDLQDPPEIIPNLIDKWIDGYEIVYAVRKNRKENIIKRLCYFLFYRILNKISEVNIPIDSGDFSAIDKSVLNIIKSFDERNIFLRGIRSWVGFKQIGVEYERSARNAGFPKLTLKKLIKLSYDGFISFSYQPLKIATKLGLLTTLISFASIIYIMFLNIFKNVEVQGWSSTVIIMLFLGGIQLLVIGTLGEYIARIHEEVKKRPIYVIKSSNNIK